MWHKCPNKECKSKDFEEPYYCDFENVGYEIGGNVIVKCKECGHEYSEKMYCRSTSYKPYYNEGAERVFNSRDEEKKYIKDNNLLSY